MDRTHEARMERLSHLRQARDILREREPTLFNAVLAVLADADLIGIGGICDDEARSREAYAPIVGTILPRLVGGMPCAAIQTIIFEEMTAWFNTPPGGSIVGAPERYTRVAEQIGDIWNTSRDSESKVNMRLSSGLFQDEI